MAVVVSVQGRSGPGPWRRPRYRAQQESLTTQRPLSFACPFVQVCSPNEKHYKGLHKGNDHGRGLFLYHPLWQPDELVAAREYFPVDGNVLTRTR